MSQILEQRGSPNAETRHGARTRSPHTETRHGARTRRRDTEPAHGDATRSPHTETRHGARTRSPHTEPAHGDTTRSPHTEPAHGDTTRSPHTETRHGTRTRSPHMETRHGARTRRHDTEPKHGARTRRHDTEPAHGVRTWRHKCRHRTECGHRVCNTPSLQVHRVCTNTECRAAKPNDTTEMWQSYKMVWTPHRPNTEYGALSPYTASHRLEYGQPVFEHRLVYKCPFRSEKHTVFTYTESSSHRVFKYRVQRWLQSPNTEHRVQTQRMAEHRHREQAPESACTESARTPSLQVHRVCAATGADQLEYGRPVVVEHRLVYRLSVPSLQTI
jgi:hypothetical protein